MVDYPNIFGQGMAAFDAQTKRLNAFDQDRASKTAGAAIAEGDYAGGANAFNQAGMVEQGHNVLADQQVLEDRKTRASNDVADRAQKSQAIKLDGMLKITNMVAAQPAGQRSAYLKQHLKLIGDLGLPADQFASLTEDQLSDQSLASFQAGLGKAKEDYTMGGVRYSGTNDKPKAGFAEFDPHKTIYAVGDEPPAAAGGAPPPQAAPSASPDVAAPASTVRGVRNNNPLNLTTLPHGQWAGQTGADGRFATFDTPQAGFAAADKNLVSYATNHGINTVAGIINRWAPAGDGGNDPKAYAATVAKDVGVDPNATLDLGNSQTRAVILHAMSKVELGGSGAQLVAGGANAVQGSAGADAPSSPLPPPAKIAGFHVVSQAKPEWQDMRDGRQRNTITGKVEGTKDSPDEAPLSPDGVALVGAQYLQFGPDALKNMGQGKAGVGNKTAVMEWVAKTAKEAGTANPQLVARFAQNKANQAALTQNTKMLTAISASEHTLDKNLDYAMTFAKAGVGPTGVPMMDTPINKLRSQLGSEDAKNLDNLLTTTGNEYAKILSSTTGTGGATSDSARTEAQKLIHGGMTLRQLTSAVKIAKQEAENRRLSYAGESSRLVSEISGVPQSAPPQSATPAPAANSAGGWGNATVVRR